jgi:hypothetical protein
MAPRCQGVFVPIFRSGASDSYRVCTQLDLARALALAMERGAHIINVSAGEFAPLGEASPFLEKLVQDCVRQGVLIVAAAGNQGCECLHVPAALSSVLAVGAMNWRGEPLPWSNWGSLYQAQGILAPGELIAGARPGAGVYLATGTSPATALVSGIAGLLMSLQVKRRLKPDPLLVREALLQSAGGCPDSLPMDCRRFLAGRLNVEGAVSLITRGKSPMSEPGIELQANGASPHAPAPDPAPSPGLPIPNSPAAARAPEPSGVQPSACAACQQAAARPGLVYSLGQIGYDFTSEARLDSFAQKLAAVAGAVGPPRHLAFEPPQMLAYLADHPWDAASLEWTLSLDGHPIYAIRPQGPFAAEIYQQLRDFLQHRVNGVERFSIPGVLAGQAQLLLGQTVPVVVPDPRAMYSWNTSALVQAVVGAPPGARASAAGREQHARRMAALQNFLERVYHELRNLGVSPQERAINYAATNGFEAGRIFESALQQNMELDSIIVVRSPVGRQGSDSWDVELYFFYPERQVQTVRRVFRYTVDVSDIVPVTVGPVRSWFTR